MKFVAALLLAASPAFAQLRAVEASPRAVPLRYALILNSPAPSLSAGSAFLSDPRAQSWFAANRPEQYPVLVRGALGLKDWEQTLTAYDDPRMLREAILSRPESPIGSDPARLLGLVDGAPALAAKRALFEQAVLEWSSLGRDTRAALEAAGFPEKTWAALPLPERYATVRRVLQESAGALITAQPGDPVFAAQYEAAIQRLGAVMSDEELAGHVKAIESAKRSASALTGDAAAGEAAPEAEYDLSPAETKALLARLVPAILATVRGTPSGDALLAEVSGRLSLEIGATSRDGALATFHEDSSSIVLGGKQLAELTAALGRTPRALLTDDAALADASVLYSHLYVHEATHSRQERWSERLPEGARRLAYNHESEVEANDAQAKFLREKRAADPVFAAREQRLRGVWGLVAAVMRQPEALASDPAAMSAWLAEGYRHVPSLARSGARLIGYGLAADRDRAGIARRVDVELALRSRLSAAERLDLGREDRDGSDGFEGLATGELRRLRSSLRGQAQAMVAAAQALAARAEGEIAKLQ